MTQPRGTRALLAVAALAVAFAAADTYVVVMALPDMMKTAGVPISDLQRAAPIVSGFLLGYVAMLPLIGRIADLQGRVPVLLMSLVVFSLGSVVTAFSYDLSSMVVGRFLQGVGGGGLVPATLALVADLYPVSRRSVPLGVVSAVQEIGSVLGPLFGAVVMALLEWQFIFLINLVVGLALAVVLRSMARRGLAGAGEAERTAPRRRRPDPIAALALVTGFTAWVLLALRPVPVRQHLVIGQIYIPYSGDGLWLTPVGVTVIGAALVFGLRCWFARRPMVDLRGWWQALRAADLVGAVLLGASLAGVILAFATADPQVQVFSEQGPWFLLGSLLALVVLVVHLRRASDPLIPRGTLTAVPAWGSLLVSFLVGAALIAALVDIPIFARTTTYRESQVAAAMVLVRFLVALPVGAVVGGYLSHRMPAGVVTALGMVAAAVGFVAMSQWQEDALEAAVTSTLVLLLAGFGFGLALAPVNAALLASTRDEAHGVAAALVVVARMVGMLVGVSALTTLGLRRFHAAVADGSTPFEAALVQEQTVFLGAAGCALVAAVAALVLFRDARTRG